jgi:hypothetical protein
MGAIENLCPRTVWIDGGKLRMDGESDDVIAKYLATFSESQRSGYDLEHTPNRGGNGMIRFTRVDFFDANGQPTSVFRSGEPFRARFHYKVNEQRIRDPHFGMIIHSDLGTRVTTVSTWHAAYYIPHVEQGEGMIELQIDDLFLQPNRYFLSLFVDSTGQRFDSLDHCIAIDVEDSNAYDNQGRGLHARWGLVYMPSRWNLERPIERAMER